MSRHISWPSIGQFRETVKAVQHRAIYVGKDDEGNVIVDRTRKAPTLTFVGTCKVHGTNASVAFGQGEMWCQSRSNIITPQYDNAGFAMFVESCKITFAEILMNGLHAVEFNDTTDTMVVFGEFCGGNIQKGVAITGLPKMFIVFGMALVDAEGNKTYLTKDQVLQSMRDCNVPNIFNIWQFQTFEVEIDFENPHLIQNELNKLTELVGDQCPVGFSFGVTGVGEGIVWAPKDEPYRQDSGLWFKVKDERHSQSKVKTLAAVDVERFENIKALAETLANNGRLQQGVQEVFNTLNGGEVDIKRMGDFIRWVMQDVFKEEMDTITASGFNGKEISGPVSKICRDFILHELEV